MPILYLQKLVKSRQRQQIESQFSQFIVSLDNYEAASKKNRAFLHETQIIKSTADILKRYDKNNSLPKTLVTSIKTVITALYDFVKLLEAFPLNEKLELTYEEIEDLQDCELMRMDLESIIDLKTIKVSFNFIYFQSILTNKRSKKIIQMIVMSKRSYNADSKKL